MYCVIRYILPLIVFFSVVSCKDKTKSQITNVDIPTLDTIFFSLDNDYSDLINRKDSQKFIILNEDDNTMFAEINKIIDTGDKFVIVDSYGAKTVVSFDYDGNPVACYGKKGVAPGEYAYPWYVDADSNYIYVLDAPSKKMIKYLYTGEYKSYKELPFRANAFILLNDGRYLFSLEPIDSSHSQLCLTDSDFTPIKYMLPYPANYNGGWVTNDAFRRIGERINYYQSPSDTIYELDLRGDITGKHLLSFSGGSIPDVAKLDFISAEEQGLITYGMQLMNNPVMLSNGYIFSEVGKYDDRSKCFIALDKNIDKCYAKLYGDNMSVYDIIFPMTSSYNNKSVISMINREMAEECIDYDSLSEKIKSALSDTKRVLMITSFE